MQFIYKLVFVTCFSFTSILNAQIESSESGFRIEEESAPPTEGIKKGMIGTKLTAFMADDINGTTRSSFKYKGKNLVLFFFKEECMDCKSISNEIMSLGSDFNKKANFLAFYRDDKESLARLQQENFINFPIIANASFLTDGMYISEFGYPRVFIVDPEGKIKAIMDEAYFKSKKSFGVDLRNFLDN